MFKSSVEGYWETLWISQGEAVLWRVFRALSQFKICFVHFICFMSPSIGDDISVTLTPSGKRCPAPTGLMAALSFVLIHQRAHELEKRTDVSERRGSLAESCTLEPLKPTESRTEQLYLPLLSLEAAIHVSSSGSRVECFHPMGFFLVQVSPMRANICSTEVSLSKTLGPYQLHGWMPLCSCRVINTAIFIAIHEDSLRFMSLLWPLPRQKMTEDVYLLPEVMHSLVAHQVQLFSAGAGSAPVCKSNFCLYYLHKAS